MSVKAAEVQLPESHEGLQLSAISNSWQQLVSVTIHFLPDVQLLISGPFVLKATELITALEKTSHADYRDYDQTGLSGQVCQRGTSGKMFRDFD